MAIKTEIEIEALLKWAYVDELSKRQLSSAEGIWDRLHENGQLGIDRDRSHGAAQRYAHFGLPDPDAERIEKAVSALEDTVIDWEQSFEAIADELAALVSVNDLAPPGSPGARKPKAGWGKAGERALNAWWGKKGTQAPHDRPRDVLLVGGLRTGALVTMHAVKESRPDWREEGPLPYPVAAATGSNAAVVGECRGKNLYTLGSYCPLRWEPSPLSIVMGRAEYVAWHHGLDQLARTLQLEKFTVLPPAAPQTPWRDGVKLEGRIIHLPSKPNWLPLPLKPEREQAGPPLRRKKAGPVRSVELE
jgi:hypothetical protein